MRRSSVRRRAKAQPAGRNNSECRARERPILSGPHRSDLPDEGPIGAKIKGLDISRVATQMKTRQLSENILIAVDNQRPGYSISFFISSTNTEGKMQSPTTRAGGAVATDETDRLISSDKVVGTAVYDLQGE